MIAQPNWLPAIYLKQHAMHGRVGDEEVRVALTKGPMKGGEGQFPFYDRQIGHQVTVVGADDHQNDQPKSRSDVPRHTRNWKFVVAYNHGRSDVTIDVLIKRTCANKSCILYN